MSACIFKKGFKCSCLIFFLYKLRMFYMKKIAKYAK